MLRRIFSVVIFILLLASMLTLAFNIQPVKASGTIYIRADGSIDPPTAPISTVDNLTYTFTGDINDSIVIERDNIVVDGAGYTLQGTNTYESRGTDMTGRSNITIKNTNIKNYWYGIWLNSSSSNSISGSNITANGGCGIYLYSSSNYNSISGNDITNNGGGIWLDSSSANSISGNNITTNNGYGIYLADSDSNSISGNNITTNSAYGVYLVDSDSNSISGNIITNNADGIWLYSSLSNSISGNEFINNGLFVGTSYQNSVENNTVNGRPLVYLVGVSDYTVDDAGQVLLFRCDNIRVEGLNLSTTAVGVELWETSNSTISGNNMTNNEDGILLVYSDSNSISGNMITDNAFGIWLYSSFANSISGNNIAANYEYGIYLGDSDSNNISGDNIVNNGDGVWLDSSSNNTISGNNITANNTHGILLYYSSSYNSISGNNVTANKLYGIRFYSSSNNSIFHNNFINNAQQVYSSDSVNVWDDGYPSGGNYWSDYTGTDFYSGLYQNETGSDGIGDTPYVIDMNNQDNYPLMPSIVSIAGDLNLDGIVDISDAILAALAFGSYPGHPRWNDQADLNHDNEVDIFDIIILVNNFGKHSF